MRSCEKFGEPLRHRRGSEARRNDINSLQSRECERAVARAIFSRLLSLASGLWDARSRVPFSGEEPRAFSGDLGPLLIKEYAWKLSGILIQPEQEAAGPRKQRVALRYILLVGHARP